MGMLDSHMYGSRRCRGLEQITLMSGLRDVMC
jgi:hypothetical protein